MASNLTSAEESGVKEFVSIVNELRLRQNIGPLSWGSAVKFMMARKFDTHRSLLLYQSHEILRKTENLTRFDPTSGPLKRELETGKFTVLPTRDSGGAALALFSAGKHDPFFTSHQTTLQGIIYQLDVALENVQTQRCGMVFIYNMSESKYSNFDYDLSQKLLTILKGCYPARLKKVLIVTAPLWFKAPFKILRLFVREKLRERVYMVSVPQLPLHLPIASLPVELGGVYKVDHHSWLLHCLKSMENRCEDISRLTSTPTSPAAVYNGGYNSHIIQTKIMNGTLLHVHSSEGETDESSDRQASVYEKQNSESREKEVEFIKKSSGLLEKKLTDCVTLGDPPAFEANSSSCSPSSSLSNDSLHTDNGHGLSFDEFIEHLQEKGKKGLYRAYAEIKAKKPEGTFECSRLKPNLSKNRYTDVMTYDHSRVKLSLIDSDPCSDYINANFVDGYKQKNAFISTQGPLPKTFVDFWRMVWEQRVSVIVMTTRTLERCRMKCGQYWPKEEETGVDHGPFLVYNAGIEEFQNYIITTLLVTNTKTAQFVQIFHMQFTSWPDYGVPHSALAMLEFRDKVREKQRQSLANLGGTWHGHANGPPIVVHCSAGIGRTGTFITLDICICRFETTGLIDVRTTVEKIRFQRAHSIQMPDQYVFCHLALLEYALSRGILQDVDLSSFNNTDSDSE